MVSLSFLGLHRAALPQLSGYAQKIMLGFTLCFNNKNPNGFSYSTIQAMPSIPLDQCAHYQCKAPSIRGSVFCIEHAPAQKTSKDRQAFNTPYKTAAWAAIRARQLSREPLCAACKLDGRITQASHVDHLFPWAAIGAKAFTRNLFQSLCPECHGIKSGLEKRGVFRHYTDKAQDYTAQDYAYTMMQA